MKILLIQPPIRDFYDTSARLQPIGLAYLKSSLLRHYPGVEVIVKDFHQGWGRKTIALPPELAGLKDLYKIHDKGPFSTFHHFYHFGASYETIADYVQNEKPDLVGISALFTPYQKEVVQTANAIKSKLSVPIVVGGSHISADYKSVLNDPSVDFIIRGEGERPLVELVKALDHDGDFSRVPNLGYKKDGKICVNNMVENFAVDDIPVPDFEDLNPEQYSRENKRICFIITSRGCPYHCSFCSIHQTFGKKYRRRSVDSIMAELEQRCAEGYRVIDFEDDNIAYDHMEFKQLCLQIIGNFRFREIKFTAQNGICYQNLDPELLQLMKWAGFDELNLSLVTMNSDINREVRRPHSISKFEEIVSHAHRLGFRITVHQILGLPGESIDSMLDTLIQISGLPVMPGVSPFYLLPGSDLIRFYKSYHREDQIRARLTMMGNLKNPEQREQIYTMFIIARIIHFLKRTDADSDIRLADLFVNEPQGADHMKIGLGLLQKLLEERVLYAPTPNGIQPLPYFQFDVFEKFWTRLPYIQAMNGRKIFV